MERQAAFMEYQETVEKQKSDGMQTGYYGTSRNGSLNTKKL